MFIIKWVESNRTTVLEFKNVIEFSEWAREQAFCTNEQIIILNGN